jgi:hypothetical protein
MLVLLLTVLLYDVKEKGGSLCICAFQKSSAETSLKQRPFDFTKYSFRHVALKIAYLGWDYQVCIQLCDFNTSKITVFCFWIG